jgi:hypothetical protein
VNRPRAIHRSAVSWVAVAAVCLQLTACSRHGGALGEGAGSCVSIVRFRGGSYLGMTVAVEPIRGKILGDAILPPCNDSGGQSTDHSERLTVAAFPGLRPDVALIWAENPDRLFVRQDLKALPERVARLVRPPRCNPEDAPVHLSGPWLGIHGADGKTELDLLPPYNVMLRVDRASSVGYDRAHLTVRVPVSLGVPLTHDDVKTSLWQGGTISIAAKCAGGRFIAQSIQTAPPS